MTGLKLIIGKKTVTHYGRGEVRNVVTTKYTSRKYYIGGLETTEVVAVLECGHTIPFRDAGKRTRCRCYECDYPFITADENSAGG